MIIWSGPSKIDGSPIVAIITGVSKSKKSKNSKTGDMPQVWILRADMHPTEALRTGADASVCGNCVHRPKKLGKDALKKNSRTCYVNTMSFNSIYKKYANGGYKVADLSELRDILEGYHVRLGAYGDPAAVPIEVWDVLLSKCKSTGYTHQWKDCDQRYSEYCMASCDTPMDVLLSTGMGYRTFFVQNVKDYSSAAHNCGSVKLSWCPASKEKNKVTTCSKCMVCSGTRSGLKSNVSIMIH